MDKFDYFVYNQMCYKYNMQYTGSDRFGQAKFQSNQSQLETIDKKLPGSKKIIINTFRKLARTHSRSIDDKFLLDLLNSIENHHELELSKIDEMILKHPKLPLSDEQNLLNLIKEFKEDCANELLNEPNDKCSRSFALFRDWYKTSVDVSRMMLTKREFIELMRKSLLIQTQ